MPVLGRATVALGYFVGMGNGLQQHARDHPPEDPNQDRPQTPGIACPETILRNWIHLRNFLFIKGWYLPCLGASCTYFRHPAIVLLAFAFKVVSLLDH